MTNAPFRAAFWTMCCAFLLSVAMIASSPEAGRFVSILLNPEQSRRRAEIAIPTVVLGQHQQLEFPSDIETGEAHLEVPDPYIEPGSEQPHSLAESTGTGWPAIYSPPAVTGLRTASADPSVVLGMIEQQAPLESSRVKSPRTELVTTPAIEISPILEPYAKNIRVPEPAAATDQRPLIVTRDEFPEPELKRLQGSVTQLQMAQIERELAEARSKERGKLQRIADGELTEIYDRLKEFRERFAPEANGAVVGGERAGSQVVTTLAASGTTTSVTPSSEANTESTQPEESGTEASESLLSISETSQEGRYDVSIRETEVGEVLRQLGRRLGWRVIVSPEVTGNFTGDFHDADLDQAFVMVVKAHQLGVDRRGDYILIRPRSLR